MGLEKNLERFLGKRMDVVLDTGKRFLTVTTGIVDKIDRTDVSLTVLYKDGRSERYKTNVKNFGYYDTFVTITYNDNSETFLEFS